MLPNLDSAHQLAHERDSVAAFLSPPFLAPGSVVASGEGDRASGEAAFHFDHVGCLLGWVLDRIRDRFCAGERDIVLVVGRTQLVQPEAEPLAQKEC